MIILWAIVLILLVPAAAHAVPLAIAAAAAAVAGSTAAAVGATLSTVMTVASIGWSVGSMLAGLLFPPKPQQIGPRLTDLDVTSSAFGEPVRDSWGTIALPGLLVDASKLKEKKHKAGGKGIFGGSPSGFFYTYSVDAAWMFRRREAAGILRIWMGPKLVRNVPEGATIEEILASNFPFTNGGLKIYLGSEDQLPDPTLEALHGVGNVPAYRGIVYIVVPIFNWRITATRCRRRRRKCSTAAANRSRSFPDGARPPASGWRGSPNRVGIISTITARLFSS
jgi:hypothetical protein